MRFDDHAINIEAIEAGEWRPAEGFPGVEFKVRGVPNTDWTAIETKLASRAVPPSNEVIRNECLLEACLQDWRGVEGPDGKPEPFTKARAEELIKEPRFRKIRNSILSTALVFGNETVLERKAAGKN